MSLLEKAGDGETALGSDVMSAALEGYTLLITPMQARRDAGPVRPDDGLASAGPSVSALSEAETG